MLKDEIKKKSIKIKWPESNRVNSPNSWPRSWIRDNFIENKLKKWPKSTWVKLLNSWSGSTRLR
jgi:hypothetical protein